MSEEWGPWVEHDGGTCPVPVGTIVHLQYEEPVPRWVAASYSCEWQPDGTIIAVILIGSDQHWIRTPDLITVLRYRVRKPKGLAICEHILRRVEKRQRKGVPA